MIPKISKFMIILYVHIKFHLIVVTFFLNREHSCSESIVSASQYTLRLIHCVNIDRTRLDGDLWSLHYCTSAWLVLAYTADNIKEFASIHTFKINNNKILCPTIVRNPWSLVGVKVIFFSCFWIITGKGYFGHLLADLSYQWKLWNKKKQIMAWINQLNVTNVFLIMKLEI